MTSRLLIAALGLSVLIASNAGATGLSSIAPAMRAEATVATDIVRLGDLVDNAGPAASIPVFHAPELGASGTVQAHRVLEVARQNGIAHLDTRGLQEITIFRAARMVTIADLEAAVADAAVRHLGLAKANDVTVRFDRDVRALQIEPGAHETPRIGRFAYDAHTTRFEGIIEVQGSLSLRRSPVRVTGWLMETAEIVVVARALARGETIRDSDILVERRPRSEVASDVVTKASAAIGQAARRALRPGQSLRPADLMKPDLVSRNEAVTIVFEMPGITLTARGKAIDAGAQGDIVSVLNAQSKRTLQATVRGPGLVVVGPGGATFADATGRTR
jgi:flagella basal body P-ring formation protein FlgA